jgi:peptidoglycan-associated lipoprotein
MKNLTRFFGILVTVSVVALVGCSTPSKTHGTYGDAATTAGGEETLPTYGGEDPLNGIPVPARPEGVNPDTDVDYMTLAAETVYFDFDSSSIRSGERGKLENVSKYLTQNPGKRLMFAGHTDQSGTSEYNRGLGERRALAVRDYLIGLGVASSQLFTISYGEDRPASMGTSDTDNAKNRRAVPGVITK